MQTVKPISFRFLFLKQFGRALLTGAFAGFCYWAFLVVDHARLIVPTGEWPDWMWDVQSAAPILIPLLAMFGTASGFWSLILLGISFFTLAGITSNKLASLGLASVGVGIASVPVIFSALCLLTAIIAFSFFFLGLLLALFPLAILLILLAFFLR